ncbi:MAG: RNA polymerase sigma factor [Lentisphaerales bacterium]|nr:RNA polymerase sigma factor [Lentisphaerales bacterium]
MSDWNTRQSLLIRLKDKHDDQSWEDFVKFYKPFIYMMVRKMNFDHHDAEEVVQQITLKAWRSLPEFNYSPDKGRFRSWLSRMTHNTVLDVIKSRQRYSNRLEKYKDVDHLQKLSAPEIENMANVEWQTYITNLAWKNVSPDFTEKVRLAFERSLKGDDAEIIAEDLGLTKNAIYVYKKRVKERLTEEVRRLKEELE